MTPEQKAARNARRRELRRQARIEQACVDLTVALKALQSFNRVVRKEEATIEDIPLSLTRFRGLLLDETAKLSTPNVSAGVKDKDLLAWLELG